MKKSKQISEEQAVKTVKRNAYGVFFISSILFGFVVFSLTVDKQAETSSFVAGIFMTASVISFIFGWFLFKKQSYPTALTLTIITGIYLGLNIIDLLFKIYSLFLTPSSNLTGGQMLPGPILSLVFFGICYRGFKAAKTLKEICRGKISPNIFS